MSQVLHQTIHDLFQNADRILIAAHIRPDGDAVGALLGLGLSLQAVGKNVQMVLSDGVPVSFRHLPGSKQVVKTSAGDFDLVVTVDCSDLARTGSALGGRPVNLCIDHHITNDGFAEVNFVVPTSEATSSILTDYLSDWGLPINEPVAQALLTGIVSDTLGFRTTNVTPHTLRRAARLMEHGADLAELYSKALITRSYESAAYWGQGLTNLHRENRLVWATLSLEDRKKAGYAGNDDADLINILSSIDGADISMILIEQSPTRVKVSWRAAPGFDVSVLALQFGGGGHPAAAGAEISGALGEVEQKVLEATRPLVVSKNGLSNGSGNHTP